METGQNTFAAVASALLQFSGKGGINSNNSNPNGNADSNSVPSTSSKRPVDEPVHRKLESGSGDECKDELSVMDEGKEGLPTDCNGTPQQKMELAGAEKIGVGMDVDAGVLDREERAVDCVSGKDCEGSGRVGGVYGKRDSMGECGVGAGLDSKNGDDGGKVAGDWQCGTGQADPVGSVAKKGEMELDMDMEMVGSKGGGCPVAVPQEKDKEKDKDKDKLKPQLGVFSECASQFFKDVFDDAEELLDTPESVSKTDEWAVCNVNATTPAGRHSKNGERRGEEGVCVKAEESEILSQGDVSGFSSPSSPESKDQEWELVYCCSGRKRSARAGAGARLAKLVTQEAKSLKTMEREATEQRRAAIREERREKRIRRGAKGGKTKDDINRVGAAAQQTGAQDKLLSGSLLGLWKRRGRPPKHLKDKIIQQALHCQTPDEDQSPSDYHPDECGQYPLCSSKKKHSHQAKGQLYDQMQEVSSANEEDDSDDEDDDVEKEHLYGCQTCSYLWDGCGECNDREPLATRPKSNWDKDNGQPQQVPAAPTYRPTPEEFKNPFAYIAKIRPEAEKYGICMITPPAGWDPPFEHKTEGHAAEEFKFCPKRQRVNNLCMRSLKIGSSGGCQEEKSDSGSTHNGARMARMCPSSQQDEFGFHVVDTPISMKGFVSYAKWSMEKHFGERAKGEAGQKLSVHEIESEFWRVVVKEPDVPVEALYGSDLDSGQLGSGFPRPSNPPSTNPCTVEDGRVGEYRKHAWNINSWPRGTQSVLRHVMGDELITGVMVPWLYVGSCLSAFCWHVEDHALYSVNYMHAGATKVWYGVPGYAGEGFETAMMDALPQLFKADPNLLHRLVTHMSPMELNKRGVPVYRLEHNPGSFVITFPNAYHGGFNCGWNCAEAVNFAPPDWLPHGTDASLKYRKQSRSTTFSHDALLVTLVSQGTDQHQKQDTNVGKEEKKGELQGGVQDRIPELTVKYAVGELVLRIDEEHQRRTIAGRAGIDKECRMYGEQYGKDENGVNTNTEDMDCELCKCDLYLSAVVSPEAPGVAMCPEHASQLPGTRILLYRYTIPEMQAIVNKAVAAFPDSVDFVRKAQERLRYGKRFAITPKGPLTVPPKKPKPPPVRVKPPTQGILGKRTETASVPAPVAVKKAKLDPIVQPPQKPVHLPKEALPVQVYVPCGVPHTVPHVPQAVLQSAPKQVHAVQQAVSQAVPAIQIVQHAGVLPIQQFVKPPGMPAKTPQPQVVHVVQPPQQAVQPAVQKAVQRSDPTVQGSAPQIQYLGRVGKGWNIQHVIPLNLSNFPAQQILGNAPQGSIITLAPGQLAQLLGQPPVDLMLNANQVLRMPSVVRAPTARPDVNQPSANPVPSAVPVSRQSGSNGDGHNAKGSPGNAAVPVGGSVGLKGSECVNEKLKVGGAGIGQEGGAASGQICTGTSLPMR